MKALIRGLNPAGKEGWQHRSGFKEMQMDCAMDGKRVQYEWAFLSIKAKKRQARRT